jgi:hypothetical protein
MRCSLPFWNSIVMRMNEKELPLHLLDWYVIRGTSRLFHCRFLARFRVREFHFRILGWVCVLLGEGRTVFCSFCPGCQCYLAFSFALIDFSMQFGVSFPILRGDLSLFKLLQWSIILFLLLTELPKLLISKRIFLAKLHDFLVNLAK